jgi:hypothetical protein
MQVNALPGEAVPVTQVLTQASPKLFGLTQVLVVPVVLQAETAGQMFATTVAGVTTLGSKRLAAQGELSVVA